MAGNRSSLIVEMWRNFKKSLVIFRTKDKFIGSDEFGNKYFEREADMEKDLKRQRRVVAKDPDQTIVPKVPVEWMTWLQGRRIDPPTEEEIEKNRLNTMKVLARAAKLQEKDNIEAGKNLESSTSHQIIERGKFPIYKDMEQTPGEKQ